MENLLNDYASVDIKDSNIKSSIDDVNSNNHVAYCCLQKQIFKFSPGCSKALDFVMTERLIPRFSSYLQKEVNEHLEKEPDIGILYSQLIEWKINSFFYEIAKKKDKKDS